MADTDFDLADNLGDINTVLHNQSVSDLSWLAVDEAAYRAAEVLPKQNLDIIPELSHALTMGPDDDVPHVIPMRPHVIVNENPLERRDVNPVDVSNPIRNRVARLVMDGKSEKEIRDSLSLEFSRSQIANSESTISNVLSEAGLLGNVYIDSSHFPRCAQNDAKDRKIISSCGKRALYVLAKPECSGCVRNQNGRCASFQKNIVDDIKYNAKLAAHYAPGLAAENRSEPLADNSIPWKKRLQIAFSTPVHVINPDGVRQAHYQPKVKPLKITPEMVQEVADSKKPRVNISSTYAKFARRMMDGHDDREYLTNSHDSELVKLASEYGLLGYTYIDMDALGGCRNTIAFLKSRNLKPDFVIRRNASCQICRNTSDGGCARICNQSRIVDDLPTYGKSEFASALKRANLNNIISAENSAKALSRVASNSDFKSLTAQVNTFRPSSSPVVYSNSTIKAHYGSSESQSEAIDPEEVRRFISHLLNTGLSGTPLQKAILSRYTKSDLKDFASEGRRMASEEGIQGHYYLDPTAYKDYSRGCLEGSSIFKNRGPKNVLASSGCTGCTHQNAPGWCSRYCKSLIRSVPQSVRSASESARRLPVIQSAPVENPVDKYELSSTISVEASSQNKNVDISFDSYSIGD